MIRSRLVNLIVLVIGIVLLGGPIAEVVGYALQHALSRTPRPTPSGEALLLAALAHWQIFVLAALGLSCILGAISNFRHLQSPQASTALPLKSYALAKWNLFVLLASFAGLLLSIIFAVRIAPVFEFAIGLSLVAVPVILGFYVIERVLYSWRRRAG